MCEQFKNSPKALDDEPQAVFDAFGPPNAVTREDGTFDYDNCQPVWEMQEGSSASIASTSRQTRAA